MLSAWVRLSDDTLFHIRFSCVIGMPEFYFHSLKTLASIILSDNIFHDISYFRICYFIRAIWRHSELSITINLLIPSRISLNNLFRYPNRSAKTKARKPHLGLRGDLGFSYSFPFIHLHAWQGTRECLERCKKIWKTIFQLKNYFQSVWFGVKFFLCKILLQILEKADFSLSTQNKQKAKNSAAKNTRRMVTSARSTSCRKIHYI